MPTNIIKNHSWQLSINDNGIGAQNDDKKDGMGLRNMNSRMKLLGGNAHILPGNGGKGTRVMLELPLTTKTKAN